MACCLANGAYHSNEILRLLWQYSILNERRWIYSVCLRRRSTTAAVGANVNITAHWLLAHCWSLECHSCKSTRTKFSSTAVLFYIVHVHVANTAPIRILNTALQSTSRSSKTLLLLVIPFYKGKRNFKNNRETAGFCQDLAPP